MAKSLHKNTTATHIKTIKTCTSLFLWTSLNLIVIKLKSCAFFFFFFFFFPTQNKTWTFIFSETLPTHCLLPCCQTDTQHIMMSSKLRFQTLISHQYFVASLTDDNISSELYLNVYIFMKRTFEGTIRSRRFTHPAQILRGTTRKLSTLSTPLRNCRKVMKERDSEKVLTPQKTSGGATEIHTRFGD